MTAASAPLELTGDAFAALELASVARGAVVLDAMAKRAATTIVAARTLSPGRYLIVISGTVAEVEEAMDAALERADSARVDHTLIRAPAPELVDGLASRLKTPLSESLLLVETATVSATLLAADRALKQTEVSMIEIRLGAGLAGKGVFTLTGALHMIEAAEVTIRDCLSDAQLIAVELIAQPHPDLPGQLLGAEPLVVRGRHHGG